jgi:hypothetical protein
MNISSDYILKHFTESDQLKNAEFMTVFIIKNWRKEIFVNLSVLKYLNQIIKEIKSEKQFYFNFPSHLAFM